MNSLVPYELAGQGALVAIVTLNWLFSFSSLKLVLLLLMGTHLAIQGMRCLPSPLRCCALPSAVLLPAHALRGALTNPELYDVNFSLPRRYAKSSTVNTD